MDWHYAEPQSGCKGLLKAVHDLARLHSTLRAASGLLREVSAEVRHVREVEVGTAEGAVRVTRYDFSCGAEKLGESVLLFDHFF